MQKKFDREGTANASFARKIARRAVLAVDPFVGRAISRHLAKQNSEPVKQLSTDEVQTTMREIRKLVELPLPTDAELKRVEIIVLKYKDPEVETICASRIIENTEWPYKLTFFDNRPGTKNMSKIWNELIRKSTCDYIVFMDSDVFVPKQEPCWLTKLMSTFEETQECYLVSPKVTKTSGVQQKAAVAINGKPERLTTDFAGMCVLYKKDIFDKVGYFDEEFLLYGSDVEWSRRFIVSKYAGYVRPDVLVDHVGHYSTTKAQKAEPAQATWGAVEKIYADEMLKKKLLTKH